MNVEQRIRIPVIMGPTAVGKTGMVMRLAEEFGCEILSCDSRQVYRYMDIGTAKPTKEQCRHIRHWMVDVIDPDTMFSAYDFAERARTVVAEAAARDTRVIVSGGTGLYFQALSRGIGPQVGHNEDFCCRYRKIARELGNRHVHQELMRCDSETARRLHPNDLQRVIRALQVFHDTGIRLSELFRNTTVPGNLEFLVVVMWLDRQALYGRINRRVDLMMALGLWNEFCSLRERGYGPDDPGMRCLGYRDLFAVEQKTISLDQAVENIKQHTRQFAKRQRTWFNHKTVGVRVDARNVDEAYADIRGRICRFLEVP